MHVFANLICLHTRIVLSFDLNENINQDEGGADVDAGSGDEEAFLGKVKLYQFTDESFSTQAIQFTHTNQKVELGCLKSPIFL